MAEFHDRLERAIQQGGDRLAIAWGSPPAGIGCHEIDRDFVIRKVNREELKILGYSEDQMLGHKVSGARELKPFVRTFKKADGTPVTLGLMDRHIKDTSGTVVGIRTSMVELKLAF
jgi:PAS domain-containing protein